MDDLMFEYFKITVWCSFFFSDVDNAHFGLYTSQKQLDCLIFDFFTISVL